MHSIIGSMPFSVDSEAHASSLGWAGLRGDNTTGGATELPDGPPVTCTGTTIGDLDRCLAADSCARGGGLVLPVLPPTVPNGLMLATLLGGTSLGLLAALAAPRMAALACSIVVETLSIVDCLLTGAIPASEFAPNVGTVEVSGTA